jgi:Rps23 Pro-64 3,4-dihydroxylase Tpa1-like proline 4-hydroxylase
VLERSESIQCVLDYERLERLASELAPGFASAEPYPHVVIDDFFPAEVANDLHAEFEIAEDSWKHYHHYNERKKALTEYDLMPKRTQQVFDALQDQRTLDLVGKMSGISDLIADPGLEGAGMHLVERGGFLNVHTDFLTHAKRRSWSRHINILIYLNKGWQEQWRGNLELWDAELSTCVQSIEPVFNRCVIFNTLEKSYHGHPHKLVCPEGRSRKSLLLYYYRDEGHELDLSSTDYQPLPNDSLSRRLLIAADRMALRIYTFIKGRTKVSDRLMDRLLRRF